MAVQKNVDPFATILAPPENETPEEKAKRERAVAEAQRVSDGIDDTLKSERAALRRQGRTPLRVLLLGQAESGKSTTLKNFRMKYAADEWEQERTSWRTIIHLNLIRSILIIVDTLDAEANDEAVESGGDSPTTTNISHSHFPDMKAEPQTALTGNHQLLKLRLGPLRGVEKDLRRYVGAGATEVTANSEFHISYRTWQDVIHRPSSPQRSAKSVADEATEVIHGCRDDMMALWHDETVHSTLTKRGVSLEDSAGFFLNDLDRITRRDYLPSDDDVVRARLRTLGIQEYKINFGRRIGLITDPAGEWILYDVGGAQTVRKAWLPYFENVNAIIFLAPVSAFNERLLENPDVNRLEDSFKIWKLLSSSKLLSRTTLVLFLNKIDIFKRKLQAGIQLKKYLPSFGDRANEVGVAVKYLRDCFRTMHRNNSHGGIAYMYPTAVTDTKATAVTLQSVRDGILRENLKDADLV